METCVEKITAGFSNHKEWEGGWVRRRELKTTELQAMFHGTNSAKKQPQMDVNNGLFIRGFIPCNPAYYCLQVLNTPFTHTHKITENVKHQIISTTCLRIAALKHAPCSAGSSFDHLPTRAGKEMVRTPAQQFCRV